MHITLPPSLLYYTVVVDKIPERPLPAYKIMVALNVAVNWSNGVTVGRNLAVTGAARVHPHNHLMVAVVAATPFVEAVMAAAADRNFQIDCCHRQNGEWAGAE